MAPEIVRDKSYREMFKFEHTLDWLKVELSDSPSLWLQIIG
jgi:hypothetical protein